MSPNCICFLIFKACNVVYRRCNYCLLCICNILNLCNAGSAFRIYLTCVIRGKEEEFWQYLHNNDAFPEIMHFYFIFPFVYGSLGVKIQKFMCQDQFFGTFYSLF